MITWIQRSFQRHFRTIFAFLLAVTVISFIFTIGATPGIGGEGRKSITRNFFGHNLASQADRQQILSDAMMSAQIKFGYRGGDQTALENYSYQRLAALYIGDKLKLPEVSSEELTNYIKGLKIFADSKGDFDAVKYSMFRSNEKGNEATVLRILSDDARIDQVKSLLGGPGYVLADDVKQELAKTETMWTVDVATLDYKSYHPNLQPTEADLQKFFADASFRYEIGARVSTDAVFFPASAYVSQVIVTEPDVRAFYDANPRRFPDPSIKPGAKPAVSPDHYATVRPQVEANLKFDRAMDLAAKAASDLAYALYDGKVARGSADAFLASHGYAPRHLAPFGIDEPPPELGASSAAAEAAFKLDNERYFSEALPISSGSVVLIWNETLAARQPAYAEVKDRVRSDYVEDERRKHFIDLGQTIKGVIEARMKTGDSFEKAVAAASSSANVSVATHTFPAFNLTSPPKDLDRSAVNSLGHLDKGAVSSMESSADKGYIVYVEDKKAPDLSEANPRFSQTRESLARLSKEQAPLYVLTGLVDSELKRADAALK